MTHREYRKNRWWTRSAASKEIRRTYCPHCPMGLRCIVDGDARISVSISYKTVELGFIQVCCETTLRQDVHTKLLPAIDKVVFYVDGSVIDNAYSGERHACVES